jgi:phage minor structural protein
METIFLNPAGTVLFVRDDMEQGNWTQEEYTVNATFPFVSGKVIQRGQRLAFRDPATGNLEMFEIRNVANIEPDHYQQVIAEHIAVSELSDEHINDTEITNKTPAQALTTALTGTLWAVGTSAVSATSSVDIARGSVWQAVLAIAENWNCYITPRVTVNAAGSITGRYLDITTTDGVFRGVRLSIDKNMADASVTVDDSEVLTALYGYGGSVEVTQTGQDDKTETLTFAGLTWTATAEHPAKPAGQTYLEDPAKTALYGRNGRARFGYYQNGDITDANTLLQKTWEALKATSEPHISITGTCADLYRLGYADQPIRLHDIAIVDIPETGETYYRKIIKCDVDLIDPTATRPEIGDYIPNIIYINRNTNEQATTGGRGGGGGGRGGSNKEMDDSETFSALEKTNNMIAMIVGTRNGNNYVKAGEIGLAINRSGETGQYESTAYINADHVNISSSTSAYTLSGAIEHDANGKLIIKNAAGLYVRRERAGVTAEFGIWDTGSLTGGVMVREINGQTETQISGNKIDINGSTITISADRIDITGIINSQVFKTAVASIEYLAGDLQVMGAVDIGGVCNVGALQIEGDSADWQSTSVVYSITKPSLMTTASDTFVTSGGTKSGRLVTSWDNGSFYTKTLHYLGSAPD